MSILRIMTIGFRNNLFVSFFKKNDNSFCVNFSRYVCFTGGSKNLLETPIMKNIFIFLGNGHCVQKCSFLVKILSFLKEVFYVFEKCHFLITFSSSGNLMENSTFLLKFHFFLHKIDIFGRKFILRETLVTTWFYHCT